MTRRNLKLIQKQRETFKCRFEVTTKLKKPIRPAPFESVFCSAARLLVVGFMVVASPDSESPSQWYSLAVSSNLGEWHVVHGRPGTRSPSRYNRLRVQ